MWDTIKTLAVKFGNPLISKLMIRVVGYGCAALSARWAEAVPDADTQQKLIAWLTTVGVAALTAGIDYLQHKFDTK